MCFPRRARRTSFRRSLSETERRLFTVDELLDDAATKETFFCGTASEIKPIIEITGASPESGVSKVTIGNGQPGPVTRELHRIFKEIVNGGHPFSRDWLEYK